MKLRILLFSLALAGCGGTQCGECKKPADGTVTLTVKDGTGALVASPTFSENGKSLAATCSDAAAATCPLWKLLLAPGGHTIAVTDGSSGVATSVPIEVVARSCDCDDPAPISMTVQLLAASAG